MLGPCGGALSGHPRPVSTLRTLRAGVALGLGFEGPGEPSAGNPGGASPITAGDRRACILPCSLLRSTCGSSPERRVPLNTQEPRPCFQKHPTWPDRSAASAEPSTQGLCWVPWGGVVTAQSNPFPRGPHRESATALDSGGPEGAREQACRCSYTCEA